MRWFLPEFSGCTNYQSLCFSLCSKKLSKFGRPSELSVPELADTYCKYLQKTSRWELAPTAPLIGNSRSATMELQLATIYEWLALLHISHLVLFALNVTVPSKSPSSIVLPSINHVITGTGSPCASHSRTCDTPGSTYWTPSSGLVNSGAFMAVIEQNESQTSHRKKLKEYLITIDSTKEQVVVL